MNKTVLLTFIFVSLLQLGRAFAYEPPNTKVESAIKHGAVSFIGRVIKIEETSYNEYLSEAIATIEIIEPFYGLKTNAGEKIKLKYYSRLFADYPNPGFPLAISISDIILFVINRPLADNKMPIYFNSYYVSPEGLKPIDLAYWAYDDPGNGYNANKKSHVFSDSYYPVGNKREEIMISDLHGWAKERREELEK